MAERSPGADRYQGGPYAVLFNPQGSKPLAQCRILGAAKVIYESQCKSQIVILQRHVSGSRLVVPSNTNAFPGAQKAVMSSPSSAMALAGAPLVVHAVVVCQVMVPLNGELNVDIAVVDTIGRYRLTFSTAFSTLHAEQQHCKLPMQNIPRGLWLELVFDVPTIYTTVNPRRGVQYRGIEGIAVGPVCWIRRVYTMRDVFGGGAPGHSKASVTGSVSASDLSAAMMPPIVMLPSVFAFPAGVQREVVLFVTGAEGIAQPPPPPPPPQVEKARKPGRQVAAQQPLTHQQENDADDGETGVSPLAAARAALRRGSPSNGANRNRGDGSSPTVAARDGRRAVASAPRARGAGLTAAVAVSRTTEAPIPAVAAAGRTTLGSADELLTRAMQATQKPPTTAPLGGSRKHMDTNALSRAALLRAASNALDRHAAQQQNQLTLLSPGHAHPDDPAVFMPRTSTDRSIVDESTIADDDPHSPQHHDDAATRHMSLNASVGPQQPGLHALGGTWRSNSTTSYDRRGHKMGAVVEVPWGFVAQDSNVSVHSPDAAPTVRDSVSRVMYEQPQFLEGSRKSSSAAADPGAARPSSSMHEVDHSDTTRSRAAKSAVSASTYSSSSSRPNQTDADDVSLHHRSAAYDDDEPVSDDLVDDEQRDRYGRSTSSSSSGDDGAVRHSGGDISDPEYGDDDDGERFHVVHVTGGRDDDVRGARLLPQTAAPAASQELDASAAFVYEHASPKGTASIVSPSRIRGHAVQHSTPPHVSPAGARRSARTAAEPSDNVKFATDLQKSAVGDATYEVITISQADDDLTRHATHNAYGGQQLAGTPLGSNSTKSLMTSRLGLPHRHGPAATSTASTRAVGMAPTSIRGGPYALGAGQLDPHDLDSVRVDALRASASPNDLPTGNSTELKRGADPEESLGLSHEGPAQWIAARVGASGWPRAGAPRYGHLDTTVLDESVKSAAAGKSRTLAALAIDTPMRMAIDAASHLPPPPPPDEPPPPSPAVAGSALAPPRPATAPRGSGVLQGQLQVHPPTPSEIPDIAPVQFHQPLYHPQRALHYHHLGAAEVAHLPGGAPSLYPPEPDAMKLDPLRPRSATNGLGGVPFFSAPLAVPADPPSSARYAGPPSDDDGETFFGNSGSDEDNNAIGAQTTDDGTEDSPYVQPPLDASQAALPLPVRALTFTAEDGGGDAVPRGVASAFSRPTSTRSRVADVSGGGNSGPRDATTSLHARYKYDPTLGVYYDVLTNTYLDALPTACREDL